MSIFSVTFSAPCIRRRRASSVASSPGSGANASISARAWRRYSSSACASAKSVRASFSNLIADARCRQAVRQLAILAEKPPNSSRITQCRRGLSSPLASCWPWISTSVSDNARNTSPEARRSLTQALLRPSARLIRRRISSLSVVIPASSRMAKAAWPGGRSKTATTSPTSYPARTMSLRPRLPNTKPSESSKIDLPAPVSPVSTLRPAPGSNTRRSMISISRISRLRSIYLTLPGVSLHAPYSHSPRTNCR